GAPYPATSFNLTAQFQRLLTRNLECKSSERKWGVKRNTSVLCPTDCYLASRHGWTRKSLRDLGESSSIPQPVQGPAHSGEKDIDFLLTNDEGRGHCDEVADAAHDDAFLAG